jgi:hypothetical protein
MSGIHDGAAGIGEMLWAAGRIDTDDPESWIAEWTALGARTESFARAEHEAAHLVTARGAFLRAATYYRAAERALAPPDSRLEEVYLAARGCFRAAAAVFDPPIESLEIPFEGGVLTGTSPSRRSHRTAPDADPGRRWRDDRRGAVVLRRRRWRRTRVRRVLHRSARSGRLAPTARLAVPPRHGDAGCRDRRRCSRATTSTPSGSRSMGSAVAGTSLRAPQHTRSGSALASRTCPGATTPPSRGRATVRRCASTRSPVRSARRWQPVAFVGRCASIPPI